MGINKDSLKILCDHCGKLHPPDPAHPAYPAQHHCFVEPETANPASTRSDVGVDYSLRTAPKLDPFAAFEVDPYEFIKACDPVMQEINRSCAKHPRYPADPLRRTAIMVEEAGEAIKDALDLTRSRVVTSMREDDDLRTRLRHEVVQTAAMAIKMLVAMNREDEARGK